MPNINKSQLLEVLREYALLCDEAQNRANKKILLDWGTSLNSFRKLIESDPELWKNIEQLSNIQHLLAFNEYEYFEKFAFIDIASEEPVYKYDEKMHQDEQYLYENWDQIQADYHEKLKTLESAKLSPLRTQRIQRLKKTFDEKSKKVKHYAFYADRMKERDHYVKNPEEVTELQNAIQNSIKPLSEQYLAELLDKQPQLICVQPNNYSTYDSELIGLCSKLKEELIHEHELQSKYFNAVEKSN